jgi:hypothetical protein
LASSGSAARLPEQSAHYLEFEGSNPAAAGTDETTAEKALCDWSDRTLPPPEKIAKSIVAVLRHFNWDRVVVLVSV